MPSIDNRIVEMQFDNAQFERGVNQSLGTLDKLKSALKLDNAAKGFDDISTSANRIDFSNLSGAIMNVSNKFSVLEIAAITAIQNIANRVTNAGINFAKSLSVDQITAGWNKFAQKAQSVNTIMAATDETVEAVGAQLDKLNKYTDETSASFTDMTSNIGKFTNAGVKLEDAAQAMQGITNWAYLSGASVNEAGRAMYNLSQAMAIGSVKLMDWKSIENANMATTKFKETVIDTAVAMGTLVETSEKGIYKVAGTSAKVSATNFNAELSRGWFSADVLTGTLDKFGSFSTDMINLSEETGMTVMDLMRHFKEFESSGLDMDFGKIAEGTGKSADEMRAAFTSMGTAYESIAKRMVKQNKTLQWQLKNGRITEEEVAEKTKDLADTLQKAFVEWSSDDGGEFEKYLKDLGLSAKQAEKIFNEMAENQSLGVAAFRAAQEYRSLRDAVDATIDAVSTGWMKTFELIFGNAEEAKRVWGSIGETLYEVFASGAEERNKMLAMWHDNGGYESFVRAIENISEAIMGLKDLMDEVFGDSFLHIGTEDVDALTSLTRKFENFTMVLKAMTTGDIEGVFDLYLEDFQKLNKDLDNVNVKEEVIGKQNWRSAISGAEVLRSVIEGVAHAFDIARTVVQGIGIALSPVFSLAKNVGSDILDLIMAISRRLGAINEDQNENGGIIGFFTKIKNTIGPIAEWLSGVIHSFMKTLTSIVDPETEGSFKDFGESFSMVFNKIGEVCKKVFPILSSIGHAIGNAITIAVDKIKEFMENASIQEFFDLLKGGIGVGIFAGVSKLISNLNGAAGSLKSGGILGLIFGTGGGEKKGIGDTIKSLPDQIANFATRIGNSVKKFVDVEAFKAFGEALLMIAGALFILAMIPTDSLSESLSLLGIAMAGIIGVMELFAKSSVAESGKMLAAGVAFAAIAAGILVLSAALLLLALVPAEKIESSLGALAGILTEVGIMLAAMQLMDPVRLLASAAALLILAPALLVIAAAFLVMSLIPADKIANGLIVMAGVLGEVVAALIILSGAGPMAMAAAAALLILSPALILMAAAIAILSAVPSDKAANAIGTLLVVLLEVVAALGVLSLIGPMVLVAAAALLILAPALILLATALLMLAFVPMDKLGTALIGLGLALAEIVAAAWALTPVVGTLVAFAGSLLAIAAASVVLGIGLMTIAAGIAALVAAGSLLVTVVVSALEAVVVAGLALLSNLFDLGAKLVNSLIEGIKSKISDLPQVAQDIINGLVQGLLGMAGEVFQAAAIIGRGLLDSIKGALGIASPSKEMISLMGYVGAGLELGADKVVSQAERIGNAIGNALTEGTEEGMSGFDELYGSPTIRPVTDLSNIQNGYDYGFGYSSMPYTRTALSGIGTGVDNVRYGSTVTTSNSPVFNIYQQPGQDSEALARIINRELGRMYVR